MALDGDNPLERREQSPRSAVLIRCAGCGHGVTDAGEGIRIKARHRHTFMNPAGDVFEVRVFRDAPGINPVGPPSDDYSWFPPFWWQIANCGGCRSQLGWVFSDDRSFVGLIANRLDESRDTAA